MLWTSLKFVEASFVLGERTLPLALALLSLESAAEPLLPRLPWGTSRPATTPKMTATIMAPTATSIQNVYLLKPNMRALPQLPPPRLLLNIGAA